MGGRSEITVRERRLVLVCKEKNVVRCDTKPVEEGEKGTPATSDEAGATVPQGIGVVLNPSGQVTARETHTTLTGQYRSPVCSLRVS